MAPGTFLLYMTGKDVLTTVFLFLIDSFLLLYFVYIGIFSLAKLVFVHIPKMLIRIISVINNLLNLFLSFYFWMLVTPLCEINSGLLVNSFFYKGRRSEFVFNVISWYFTIWFKTKMDDTLLYVWVDNDRFLWGNNDILL